MSDKPDSVEKDTIEFQEELDENPGKGDTPSDTKSSFDSVEKDDVNLNPSVGEETESNPDSIGQ